MKTKDEIEIHPWDRIAVTRQLAAKMMSVCPRTFDGRVKNGIYPKPGRDGLYSVKALKKVHEVDRDAI